MAIIKLHDDIYLASGNATKDADFQLVGDKGTPKCRFSIAAGKRKDTTTIFVDCAAWRTLASVASPIHKGDSVCIIGKLEEREYNGKTYKTLTAEWLNVAGASTATPHTAPVTAQEAQSGFADLQDDQGDLPFN